jgi:preprotein translocase subunit SecD
VTAAHAQQRSTNRVSECGNEGETRLQRPWLVLMLACTMLVAGCAQPSASQSSTSPATSTTSSVPATAAVEASAAASIPSMSFVAASGLPKGISVKPGAKLAAGSLKPFLSGQHIDSVAWAYGSVNDVRELGFDIGLDAQGSSILAAWTKRNIGEDMLVVLDGTVLAVVSAPAPITGGEFTLNAPEVLAARPQIEAAMVPR